jgi:hypothetical protein
MATTSATPTTRRKQVVTPVMEKVQIWFHFLNLAYKSKDPELVAVLEASKSKYEQWGDFRTTSWTQWWKNHSHLFAAQRIQVLSVDDEFPANSLVLSIPLDKSKSLVAKTVKRLYENALKEHGKSARLSKFRFSINKTTGKEHLVYAEKMRSYLIYAQEVYVPVMNKGGITSPDDLLDRSVGALQKYQNKRDQIKGGTQRHLRRGQKASIAVLNSGLKKDLFEFNAVQQLKRLNIYAENLLFNVAAGEFPGEYNKKRKPTKLKIVKPATKKTLPSNASNSAKSTISRHMQKKKVNGIDPYGSWSEKRRSAQEKKKTEKNQTKE